MVNQITHIGFFHKWKANSVNSAHSENLINYWSMNWAQFKDSLCYLCLSGAVVASWSLSQEWQVQIIFLNNNISCHWIQGKFSCFHYIQQKEQYDQWLPFQFLNICVYKICCSLCFKPLPLCYKTPAFNFYVESLNLGFVVPRILPKGSQVPIMAT